MLDHLDEYPNLTAACETVSAARVRGQVAAPWARQAQVGAGDRQGLATSKSERLCESGAQRLWLEAVTDEFGTRELHEAIAAVELALAEADRLLGDVRLLEHLNDPDTGQVVPITLVTHNGGPFRSCAPWLRTASGSERSNH